MLPTYPPFLILLCVSNWLNVYVVKPSKFQQNMKVIVEDLADFVGGQVGSFGNFLFTVQYGEIHL